MYKDFIELARDRYSVRKFSSRVIEEEKIKKILESALIAPTACNKQPQRIIVVNDIKGLSLLYKCSMSHFGETLAFIICYDKDNCYIRDYDRALSGEIDASIVATHMMLVAWELGIGSTWVMHFIPEAVKEEFNLPENIIPVAILKMGYPDKEAKPFPGHFQSKSIEEIVLKR